MGDDEVMLPGTIQLELELNGKQHVQLRVRSSQSRRNSQTQRFSCGALEGQAAGAKCSEAETRVNNGSSSCSSAQNSNTSLNCSSFSIIEVS